METEILPAWQVNYGPEAEERQDLKPRLNPNARQLDPDFLSRGSCPNNNQNNPDGSKAKTIGDALEEAAKLSPSKRLELKDVRAIQSAEARATGIPSGVLGGPGAYALHLFQHSNKATLGDALQDVKRCLPSDKVVCNRDASRIRDAEARNDPLGRIDPHGVAACVLSSAEYNIEHGFAPPLSPADVRMGAVGRGFPMFPVSA